MISAPSPANADAERREQVTRSDLISFIEYPLTVIFRIGSMAKYSCSLCSHIHHVRTPASGRILTVRETEHKSSLQGRPGRVTCPSQDQWSRPRLMRNTGACHWGAGFFTRLPKQKRRPEGRRAAGFGPQNVYRALTDARVKSSSPSTSKTSYSARMENENNWNLAPMP